MAYDVKLDSSQLEPKQSLYLNRTPFINPSHYRPGLVDTNRWRLVGAEPVNKLARRTIQREVSSLNWKITPTEDNENYKKAAQYYSDVFKDFRNLVSRVLKSVCELPQGGALEIGWIKPGLFGEGDRGTPSFVKFIDAGTLHPTINSEYPIVQIDPYNTTRRVLFAENEINRFIAYPYDEFDKEWWQESPTMASYMAIEALSRIYIYYLKQLHDTPVAGILDLMDFDEKSAKSWANSFREMLEGIDPIKIPILYEHTQEAKWLPMGRNPAELSIKEQYILYAEMVLGNYGLSKGDVRIFDEGMTKTGSAVDRRISVGSGIGFFAELIKDGFQVLLPSFLKFDYDEPDMDVDRTKAQIRAADARTIQTLEWLPPAKKAEQALKWGTVDVDLDMKEVEEQAALAAATGMIGNKKPGQLVEGEGRTRNELLDDAKNNATTNPEVFTKAAYIELEGRKKKAAKKFSSFMERQFRKIGRRVKPSIIEEIVGKLYTQLGDLAPLNTDSMKAKAENEENPETSELRKRISELLEEILGTYFEELLDIDLPSDIADILIDYYAAAYEDGMQSVVDMVQQNLYSRGLLPSSVVDFKYNLTNPETLRILEKQALNLVKNINEGTKYYIRQAIIDGAMRGLDTSVIAENIRMGLFGVDNTYETGVFYDRIRSIVNTELNRADSTGRLGEMQAIGLTLKKWLTRTVDVCALCLRNESKESVPLDFMYEDVWGETLTPPGHPSTCHCSLGADEEELNNIGTTPEYWLGV